MRSRTCLACYIALCSSIAGIDHTSADEIVWGPEIELTQSDWREFPDDLVIGSLEVHAFCQLAWFVSMKSLNLVQEDFWVRIWGLDPLEDATPYRIHGGVI